jgi:Methylamine utilisation protein MauE
VSSFIAAAQLLLAVVLIAAAGGKVIRGREMVGALRLSRVPAAPAKLLSILVPAAELTLGFSLLVARDGALRLAFGATALLLVAFTGWLAWVRVNRLGIRCGCFGASSKEVTSLTLARNVSLIAIAIVAVFASGNTSSALPETSVYWLLTSAGASATILLAAAFNQVRGSLILSLETMRRRRDMASGIEV